MRQEVKLTLDSDVPWCLPTLEWGSIFQFSDAGQVLQSLLMSWWFESGVLDEGDMQNVQGRGASRTGLKTTEL